MNYCADLIRFEQLPYVINPELVGRAFEVKFVSAEPTDEFVGNVQR